MNNKDITQNHFSLIADFDGDISELYNKVHSDVLPVLPLRNMIMFPTVVAPILVGRESSIALVKRALKGDGIIAVACQKNSSQDNPQLSDLYEYGVVGKIVRELNLPNGNTSIILQSYGRIKLNDTIRSKFFLKAAVEDAADILPKKEDEEFPIIAESCKDLTLKFLRASEGFQEEAIFAIKNISHPVFLINFICTNLPISVKEKQSLLAESDIKQRALKLLAILNREYQYALLKQNIQNQTREELDQQQKEYFLQQQIKKIQNELGNAQNEDVAELQKKAEGLQMPGKVKELFNKELRKLERINPQSPDYSIELNYLQTLISLPWGKSTKDNINIQHAEKVLNKNHYGMEKVKERILEYLAVLQLKKDLKSPILCLYGSPGVGKTSLGKSIADALGRKYVRISLGGVHDESEIRGHRKTYIGAMPGRIVKGLIKGESDNPVFILDEIDKISPMSHNGDPQSALLEVLDYEQNNTFHDNYLDVEYDLSKVLFIATANSLDTITPPLLDRMELINVEGYLTEEKKEIAKKYLIPKIEKNLNWKSNYEYKISAPAIEYIIEKYTRESGVRQLEKQLEKVYRKLAYKLCKEADSKFSMLLKPKDIEKLLGKPIFSRDIYQGNDLAGVVTGLAWTSVGGEILFIETSLSPSKTAKLTITGNLGDVMKESAILALEYIKSHAFKWNIDAEIFEKWSIHIHVPEGATPKDGPSAGITIATSILSALTQRKVRENTAMTGEITLRGKVLPVGGIKEKILAAKRAGIKHLIICKDNKKDIEEIQEKYILGLDFCYVSQVEEVISYALLKEKVDNPIDFSANN